MHQPLLTPLVFLSSVPQTIYYPPPPPLLPSLSLLQPPYQTVHQPLLTVGPVGVAPSMHRMSSHGGGLNTSMMLPMELDSPSSTAKNNNNNTTGISSFGVGKCLCLLVNCIPFMLDNISCP